MRREDIYAAIDSERDYQDRMIQFSGRPDMIADLHVGDTLAAMQVTLNRAMEEWYSGSVPHKDAMEHVRKIAGLCVQAGEKYGMPMREIKHTATGE